MLHYLVTRRHRDTMRDYLRGFGWAMEGRVKVLLYEKIRRRVAPGVYLFSDVERLFPSWRRWAGRLADRLEAAGSRVLNHPRRVRRRYALLTALADRGINCYRASRPADDASGIRFPVFLRNEDDHEGSLTSLLTGPEELARARNTHPRALAVEFLDTADEAGVYRKYSAFRVGDRVIPRHVFASREWLIKDPDLVTEELAAEEEAFLRTNPHQDLVREVFEIAGIEYGRIDYSLLEGRPQVWEINTNPQVAGLISLRHPERWPQHQRFVAAMNEALTELADSTPRGDGPVPVPICWRWPWQSKSGL